MTDATSNASAGRPRRRGRWAAFPDTDQVPGEPAVLPTISPVVLRLHLDGADRVIDLSELPCPQLARRFAELVRVNVVDKPNLAWHTVTQAMMSIRKFLRFVAAAEPENAATFDVGDLEPGHLDGFEQALICTYGAGHRNPRVAVAAIVRLLRLEFDRHPESFDPEFGDRLRFAAREHHPRGKRPLDAYPPQVFEAIKNAALADVRAIQRRIQAGEALAAAGQDPEIAGWDRVENALWHIDRHGPLTMAFLRPLIGKRLGNGRTLNAQLYLTRADVCVLLVALICLTGMEPECAKRLRPDCLSSPARGFVTINYVKRRAGSARTKSMRISDGGALHHPGALVRLAQRLTARARAHSGSTDLWVDHGDLGLRETFPPGGQGAWQHLHDWQVRHGITELTDSDGKPVRLDLRRLRKSYKSQQYLKAAGVLSDFARGHTPEVAARHYADIPAHDELHDQAVEDGLVDALGVALPPPVVLDDDGARLDDSRETLTAQEVDAALTRERDVFLASCRDFNDSPFGVRGKPCPVALWGCFECTNAVFTTRHLPQVLTFLDFLERQREEYSGPEWTVRFGLAWNRIVHGIRAKFRDEQVATAQAVAEAGGASLLLPPEFWSRA